MSPIRMVKIESASRLALDLNRYFNLHDVEGMSKLIRDDCVLDDHGLAPDGAMHSGKEAIVRQWRDLFARSPQIRQEIEDIFGMGDRCVMRWRSSDELSIVRGVEIYQVRNELISNIWSYVKG
jgi:predicted SnoaL-like aldol condensation-catalyzing enzyme